MKKYKNEQKWLPTCFTKDFSPKILLKKISLLIFIQLVIKDAAIVE
jgi:hypothetical protein